MINKALNLVCFHLSAYHKLRISLNGLSSVKNGRTMHATDYTKKLFMYQNEQCKIQFFIAKLSKPEHYDKYV